MNHNALRKEFQGLLKKHLITTVGISKKSLPQQKRTVKALWDTGATFSAITHKMADELKISPDDYSGRSEVKGIGGEIFEVDVARVIIKLPTMETEVETEISVKIIDFSGADLLIGMDNICRGDLSISNGARKTMFTFAVPPFENKVDLYKKAIAENRRSR